MTPQRIAYVINVFPKLSESFIAGELAELRCREVEVLILSRRLPSEEVRHDIVTRAGLVERTVYDRDAFRAALREFKPELLHAHFATEAAAVARELAGEMGLPFTFTAHRYDIYDRPPVDFGERAAAAAAVVTVSEANARYLVETLRVPAAKLHVIPCGIDTGRFQPQGLRAVPPLIVCVARLVPFKNQGLLLEACASLRERGLTFRCVLVGGGPCHDELLAKRAALHLEPFVELVGPAEQAEVLKWWQQATVGVLASNSEGMPVCLMEAAACGVPVVSTAVGGVREMVEDGVTGLVVPPGNVETLTASLERLLRDPSLAARLGAAARQRAQERFSVGQQVDRLLSLWADILASARSQVTEGKA